MKYFGCDTNEFSLTVEWCYQSQVTCNDTCTGPEYWHEISQNCSGGLQSPINIVTKKTLQADRLNEFEFIGYQETFHTNLTNNGHTVQMDLPTTLKISGGDLNATYKALQLHLHWGKDGSPGSEHTIDGEQYPMEMHIVHIKEEYNALAEATADPNGVAVLGFFFEESSTANKKYDQLINALSLINEPNNITTLQGVSLENLIPPKENRTKYYRYHGSLTTPDCSEAVVWTLFENTILLSKSQLSAFSNLTFPDGKQMINIYRPIQPRNERVVYYSSGHVVFISQMLLFLSLLLSSELSLYSN
ncbi:uncharacterized protein V6R79_000898 [Siganus canaliculatus]